MNLDSKHEAIFLIDHFPLREGGHISNLRLNYITLGRPRKNEKGEIENAAMLLHATINDATSFLKPSMADVLFAPGAPLDLNDFYVIIPDGIGAGKSSKPSDGLYDKFPCYGYLDQLSSQQMLLDHLKVKHLKMILGTSMGGMQTWLWAVTYPDMVDICVPIVSAPQQINGRNFIWREAIINAIKNDPQKWREIVAPLSNIMTGTAKMLQAEKPNKNCSIEKYNQIVASLQQKDANDCMYVFASSYDYNPEPDLQKIKSKIIAINFEDDLINPVELLDLSLVPNLHQIMLPGGYGHLSFEYGELWVERLSMVIDH
jgi:homoserine O-acetyltransferase